MFWLVLIVIPLLVVNVLVTMRLLKSHESRGRKALFAIAIWVFPFVGAFLVFVGISPPPVSPHPINDPHIPGSP